MKEIETLHNQAMDLAEKAVMLRIGKKTDESIEAFNSAFQLERQAAIQLKDSFDFEPSRSIMFRSAASLALNASLYREAEKMIAIGLSGNPPDPIADELRTLYENINKARLKTDGLLASKKTPLLSRKLRDAKKAALREAASMEATLKRAASRRTALKMATLKRTALKMAKRMLLISLLKDSKGSEKASKSNR